MLLELNYILSCLALGLGIAIDVALASLAIGPSLATAAQKRQWVIAVAATHIAFPMIGYYGFVFAYGHFPALQMLLGLCAALLVGWFLLHQFRELLVAESDHIRGFSLILVLAVSWDALWSGPAKSVQAAGWSTSQIIWSFFIAGAVVALSAAIATAAASRVARMLSNMQSRRRVAIGETIALWLEFTVIGYFGLMSVARYVLGLDWPWYAVALISALLWAAAFMANIRTLYAARLAAAQGKAA